MWRQGIGSFVRNSYFSTLCPVVVCPYLCTPDAGDLGRIRQGTNEAELAFWPDGFLSQGGKLVAPGSSRGIHILGNHFTILSFSILFTISNCPEPRSFSHGEGRADGWFIWHGCAPAETFGTYMFSSLGGKNGTAWVHPGLAPASARARHSLTVTRRIWDVVYSVYSILFYYMILYYIRLCYIRLYYIRLYIIYIYMLYYVILCYIRLYYSLARPVRASQSPDRTNILLV